VLKHRHEKKRVGALGVDHYRSAIPRNSTALQTFLNTDSCAPDLYTTRKERFDNLVSIVGTISYKQDSLLSFFTAIYGIPACSFR